MSEQSQPEKLFPATYLEELMGLVDVPAAPASVHMELRVEGQLEADRLREALHGAMSRHPLARAELLPHLHFFSTSRLWRVLPKPPQPELIEVQGEERGDQACAELIGAGIDHCRAPLHRWLLVHSPRGDRLIMSLSHLAGDGVAQLAFLRSLRRAYANEADDEVHPDLEDCRDLRRHLKPADPAHARKPVLRYYREALRAPQRVAGQGGTIGADGYGLQRLALEGDQLRNLNARRSGGATLNDVLMADLIGAIVHWNQEHGSPSGRVGLQFAFNLRPEPWRKNVMGNYCAFVALHVPPAELHDAEARLRRVQQWTVAYKETRGSGILGLHAAVGALPAGFRALLVGRMPARFYETAALSNLGADGESGSFGPQAGRVVEHWFSPPAPAGLGFAIGAIGTGGRLFLTMRYLRQRFSQAGAGRFMQLYRDLLLQT